MNIINAVSQFLYNLGPNLMVPVVMFILALVFGMGLKKSLRAGITVGIGVIVAALLGGGYWWVKSKAPR